MHQCRGANGYPETSEQQSAVLYESSRYVRMKAELHLCLPFVTLASAARMSTAHLVLALLASGAGLVCMNALRDGQATRHIWKREVLIPPPKSIADIMTGSDGRTKGTSPTCNAERAKPSIMTLALRGILGALSMVCKYTALSRLPVAVASALFCTSPLFAMVFGYMFVGEVLTLRDGVALLITTLGAGVMGSRAGLISDRTDDDHGFGVILGLLAASLTGATFVTIRKLDSKVHFLFSVFALSVGSMVAPLALQAAEGGRLFVSEVPGLGRRAVMALGGVGTFAFGAAACLNRGLQMTTAGRAALIRTCDVPVNFVVAVVVLGVPNEMRQIVGCGLIAMNTYVVASGKTS